MAFRTDLYIIVIKKTPQNFLQTLPELKAGSVQTLSVNARKLFPH